MSLSPLPIQKNPSYSELKQRIVELSERTNSLFALRVNLLPASETPKFIFAKENATLELPSLETIISDVQLLKENLTACDEDLTTCDEDLTICDEIVEKNINCGARDDVYDIVGYEGSTCGEDTDVVWSTDFKTGRLNLKDDSFYIMAMDWSGWGTNTRYQIVKSLDGSIWEAWDPYNDGNFRSLGKSWDSGLVGLSFVIYAYNFVQPTTTKRAVGMFDYPDNP